MKKSSAKQLNSLINSGISESSNYSLVEQKMSGELSGFHTFADGRPCLGGYLVSNKAGAKYWILVIDWKRDGNYYVVLYPEKHSSAPIAELHDHRDGAEVADLIWYYKPSKRDGKNPQRKDVFTQIVGSVEFVVSLPGVSVGIDNFLDDLFILADSRIAADALQAPVSGRKRSGFPEGRRIERIHKSCERASEVVQLAKSRHAERNNGALPCEICGFDFQQQYGVLGESYIEAHHKVALSDLDEGKIQETAIDDLAMVCANCHRMLHRRRPWASIKEIREVLSK